ncbi:MAG: hypothetical protein KKB70_07395 [Proteobacteria bacterium]|nr:hypothetical protein [Pseudomonadota bacterium]
MLLESWAKEETERIAAFAEWWKVKHEELPDEFPLDLEPGEFDEQYRLWEPGTEDE